MSYWTNHPSSCVFWMIALKAAPKLPVLGTKSGIERLDGSKRHENRFLWCRFAPWLF